jgi:hypothetical protein
VLLLRGTTATAAAAATSSASPAAAIPAAVASAIRAAFGRVRLSAPAARLLLVVSLGLVLVARAHF